MSTLKFELSELFKTKRFDLNLELYFFLFCLIISCTTIQVYFVLDISNNYTI